MQLLTDCDWSMLDQSQKCPRKAFNQYVAGLNRKPEHTLRQPGGREFGWAISQALDVGYQLFVLNTAQRKQLFSECFSGQVKYDDFKFHTVPLVMARAEFSDYWPAEQVSKGFTQQLGLDLLNDYFLTYRPEQYDIIDVECKGIVPMQLPDGTPYSLRYKMDRWVHRDGRYHVVETKTTATMDDTFWYNMQASFQTDIYTLGAESFYGVNVTNVILDAIRTKMPKTQRKRKDGTTPPPLKQFDRRPLVKNTARRERFLLWLNERVNNWLHRQRRQVASYHGTADNILDATWHQFAKNEKPWQYWVMNPSNCTSFFSLCQFWPLCDSDYHHAEFPKYRVSQWKPYMSHEDKTYVEATACLQQK